MVWLKLAENSQEKLVVLTCFRARMSPKYFIPIDCSMLVFFVFKLPIIMMPRVLDRDRVLWNFANQVN